jgi:hypothetical protein
MFEGRRAFDEQSMDEGLRQIAPKLALFHIEFL